ncbi:MAG: hypothetical protein R3A45_13270 [Bdellovibrionota bacterium]
MVDTNKYLIEQTKIIKQLSDRWRTSSGYGYLFIAATNGCLLDVFGSRCEGKGLTYYTEALRLSGQTIYLHDDMASFELYSQPFHF